MAGHRDTVGGVALIVAIVLVSGCGASGGTGSDGTVASDAVVATEDCATTLQRRIDDVLSAFADQSEDALQQVQALAVDSCPAPDRAAAAAAIQADVEVAIAQFQAQEDEFDADAYARLTALSIIAAALQPTPTYPVPEGFPEQFPVVGGAQLLDSTIEGDAVAARWQVHAETAGGYQSVEDFYSSALQEGVPGRWSLTGSAGGVMQGAGTVVSGDSTFTLSGYGVTGTLQLTMTEGASAITLEADLIPED